MKRAFLLFSISFSLLNASQMDALLFHGNCTTCHSETKATTAPSMMEVRQRYIAAFSSRKEFIREMVKWVKNPNEETSIMQDAIAKYELMPNLSFKQDTIEDIAGYIYETDFTKKH